LLRRIQSGPLGKPKVTVGAMVTVCPVIAFDQLPSALMHHATVPATEQDSKAPPGA